MIEFAGVLIAQVEPRTSGPSRKHTGLALKWLREGRLRSDKTTWMGRAWRLEATPRELLWLGRPKNATKWGWL